MGVKPGHLVFKDEYRLRVFEKRVLRNIVERLEINSQQSTALFVEVELSTAKVVIKDWRTY
jgi:hypothetical protein